MNLVTNPTHRRVLYCLLRAVFIASFGCFVFSALLASLWPGLEEIANLYISDIPMTDNEDILWLSIALAVTATAYVCMCSLICLGSHLHKPLKMFNDYGLIFYLVVATILCISFGLAGVAHLGEGGLADALATGFVRFSVACIPVFLLGVPIGLYEEHKEKSHV